MVIEIKSPTFIRKLAIFLCACGLLYLVGINTKGIFAESYAITPRKLLTQQDSQTWSSRDAVYARGLSSIDHALQWQAYNPDFMEIKGRLLLERCRYWDQVANWKDWEHCQQQAHDVIQSAIKLNTQSAYLWANLLLSKYNLRQFDGEFNQALKKCRILGSHELAVNRTVAYIGIREWNKWLPEQQKLFRQAMLSLQEIAPVEAKKVADNAGKGKLYCYWTRNDPKQHYSCRKKKWHKKTT